MTMDAGGVRHENPDVVQHGTIIYQFAVGLNPGVCIQHFQGLCRHAFGVLYQQGPERQIIGIVPVYQGIDVDIHRALPDYCSSNMASTSFSKSLGSVVGA